jgi:hypothetical protein
MNPEDRMDLRQSIEHHQACRDEAEATYKRLLNPDFEGTTWRRTVSEAERDVQAALGATRDLTEIPSALQQSGRVMEVLRFLLAPPLSQDQFKLLCPKWPKGTEKSAGALSEEAARAVAEVCSSWRDAARTAPFLEAGDAAAKASAIAATAHMMAVNRYRTVRRMELAHQQERAVLDLLGALGYRKRESHLVDQPGALAEREFMHATQFKTADGSSHEVDVAIGLPKRTILALECKVSNDATNSVKRVNDVLKKATAWKRQWGRFVITGAMLQGVFSSKEPRRFLEEGIELFWSHRLEELRDFLLRFG